MIFAALSLFSADAASMRGSYAQPHTKSKSWYVPVPSYNYAQTNNFRPPKSAYTHVIDNYQPQQHNGERVYYGEPQDFQIPEFQEESINVSQLPKFQPYRSERVFGKASTYGGFPKAQTTYFTREHNIRKERPFSLLAQTHRLHAGAHLEKFEKHRTYKTEVRLSNPYGQTIREEYLGTSPVGDQPIEHYGTASGVKADVISGPDYVDERTYPATSYETAAEPQEQIVEQSYEVPPGAYE